MKEEPTFSYFAGPIVSKNLSPTSSITLRECCGIIKGNQTKVLTDHLRLIQNCEEARKYKRENFPYCLFSGIFDKRGKNGLVQASGYMVLDFDHVPHLSQFMNAIRTEKNFTPELLFVSPSGDGAKLVVLRTAGSYEESFLAYSEYFDRQYGIVPDQCCKDISRACFICHDPLVHLNDSNVHIPLPLPTPPPYFSPSLPEKKESYVGGIDEYDHAIVVAERISEANIDITDGYKNWYDSAMALSNLGERGRPIFHKISALNPGYNIKDTDRQFSACLKSPVKTITLSTFFWLAKCNNIDISYPKKSTACAACAACPEGDHSLSSLPPDNDDNLPPTLIDKICIKNLPRIIQQVLTLSTTPREGDLMILSTITALSALVPNLSMTYHGDTYYPHLLTIIEGPAASGKSRINIAYYLSEWRQEDYDKEFAEKMLEYRQTQTDGSKKDKNTEKSKAPYKKSFIIPGDITDPALKTQLHDNDGVGFLVETEAETITNGYTTDYGKIGATLRKTWSHEPLSYSRKTDRVKVYVDCPKLAAVIGGTHNQIAGLVGNPSTGLFSRLAVYHLPMSPQWVDPFENKKSLRDEIIKIATNYKEFYFPVFTHRPPTTFNLTTNQRNKFNEYFTTINNTAINNLDAPEKIAVIRRYGVLVCRIAMILTALSSVEEEIPISNNLTCTDEHLDTALIMGDVLLKHSDYLLDQLAGNTSVSDQKYLTFLNLLPEKFNKREYVAIATNNGYKERTVERYIDKLIQMRKIIRSRPNFYEKIKD